MPVPRSKKNPVNLILYDQSHVGDINVISACQIESETPASAN